MRGRSYHYPDPDPDNYTDTTYYDEEEEQLDVAYQRLKIFSLTSYPNISTIKKLFIDHNNLTELPDPEYLPDLTELTCSFNKFKTIPLYPKLTFLDCSNNDITDLSQYHGTKIKYFDCSNNNGLTLNFSLPHCKQLYINDCGLVSIDLTLMPLLNIL